VEFLEGYWAMWQSNLGEQVESSRKRFDASYEEMAEALSERLGRIREALGQKNDQSDFSPFLATWRDHSQLLRDRVDTAALAGELHFPVSRGAAETAPIYDPAIARRILLTSLHPHDQQSAGASLINEAYLSHVLLRALRVGE